MTVVLDSSALITLARIGRLELLHQIADVIHIPNAVFDEVVQKGLLIYAKDQGLLAKIKPLLDEMLTAGFFLDDSRYQSLLRQVDE